MSIIRDLGVKLKYRQGTVRSPVYLSFSCGGEFSRGPQFVQTEDSVESSYTEIYGPNSLSIRTISPLLLT